MTDQPTPESQAAPNAQVNITANHDINIGGIHAPNAIINIQPSSGPYATREDYLRQIIDHHQNLEFVGIPELKDRERLRIEDVFIHLQAEREGDVQEEQELLEAYRHAEEINDREALAELIERRNALVHGRALKQRLSIEEALREHHKLVILGDPGAGKTTLLKYTTLAFAEAKSERLGLAENRLPIFIRLYDYVAKKAERREDYSLVRYLYTQADENLALKLPPNFFESELERGECCVCLDGLDELDGAGLRRDATAAVASLASRYPGNRFIVTSRLVGYEEAPLDKREFAHHTVLPLTDENITTFVQKWYAAREKDLAIRKERIEHLTKTIMAEERIKSLAANPLMLTIIALVHRIEAELPNERVKLYDKCVTAMVETWEKVKGLTVEDRERPYYKYRRRLLEQLAFWMHSQPGAKGYARKVKEGDLALQLTEFLLQDSK